MGDHEHFHNVVEGNVENSIIVQAGRIEGDVRIHLPSGPSAVVTPLVGLSQAVPEVFVGRADQQASLLGDLAAEQPAEVIVVSAVAGMGGVGKTALCKRVGAVAVDQGWFAGGAFMVDLRGYDLDGHQVAVHTVFGPLLRALGVRGENVPTAEPEQAAVYHQVLEGLAAQGQRVLLLLDNASDSRQVRDLLPRQRLHRTIVTTRETFALPGARTLELDVFTDADALELLERLIVSRCPGDTRVADEPEQADRLVALCGRLPLAVEITAAMLADDPDQPLTELADELEQAASTVTVLRHGEQAVAATFDLSWRRLLARDQPAARLLGLLTLNPGSELSTDAAAALADDEAVRPKLRTLRHTHLLNQVRRRWQLHDLIRDYVRNRVPEDDAARTRLLEYYARTATDAEHDWLETERVNLVAAVRLTARTGHHRATLALAEALDPFLAERRQTMERLSVAEYGLIAAQHLGDSSAEIDARTRIGHALTSTGRINEGITAHQQVVDLSRNVDTLMTLAIALRNARRWDEAFEIYDNAQQACQDSRGVARVRMSRGIAMLGNLRPEEAIIEMRASADLWREIDDRELCVALANLSQALSGANRPYEGIVCLNEAIELAQALELDNVEARAQVNLAVIAAALGRSREAAAAFASAIATFRTNGNDFDAILAELRYALFLARQGRFGAAIALIDRIIDDFVDQGDRQGEGDARMVLNRVYVWAERYTDAAAEREGALDLFRAAGDPDRTRLASGDSGKSIFEANLPPQQTSNVPGVAPTISTRGCLPLLIGLLPTLAAAWYFVGPWWTLAIACAGSLVALSKVAPSLEQHAAKTTREMITYNAEPRESRDVMKEGQTLEDS